MHVTRRTFLSAATTSATIAAVTPRAFARWSGQDPVRYPDPAFQMVDQSFVRFRPGTGRATSGVAGVGARARTASPSSTPRASCSVASSSPSAAPISASAG